MRRFTKLYFAIVLQCDFPIIEAVILSNPIFVFRKRLLRHLSDSFQIQMDDDFAILTQCTITPQMYRKVNIGFSSLSNRILIQATSQIFCIPITRLGKRRSRRISEKIIGTLLYQYALDKLCGSGV